MHIACDCHTRNHTKKQLIVIFVGKNVVKRSNQRGFKLLKFLKDSCCFMKGDSKYCNISDS